MITLAASASGNILGGFGAGGLALILTAVLILGTKDSSEHPLPKNAALVIGLMAGVCYLGAGQLWGIPDDLIVSTMRGFGVGSGGGVLGNVTEPAVSLTLVVVAWFVRLKARTAGVLGIGMSSVFSVSGGVWAMVAMQVGEAMARFAG
ncbi:MAG TPA: hypothetical protein DEQ61_13160 [Streptomyces sp.]|nr:hypothetical protein [Streptomyces sp.]